MNDERQVTNDAPFPAGTFRNDQCSHGVIGCAAAASADQQFCRHYRKAYCGDGGQIDKYEGSTTISPARKGNRHIFPSPTAIPVDARKNVSGDVHCAALVEVRADG
ncbi:MAG: hypothetical protein U5K38_04185 [Woeseiaceae bacterium]|nr:hypothetical protein [Woeseiaceae bacterium]